MAAPQLASYGRLVIKIGSSLLIDAAGDVDRQWLASLSRDIARLHAGGADVLVVSSGAIALGSAALGIDRRRARLGELQAAAAAGQVRLLNAWEQSLEPHGLTTAQILLTPDDTEDRRRFLNARSTFAELLKRRLVPVINENDTVSTDEIRYGDNDRLAARVAQLVMADVLVLLSDVDGLYDADPRHVDHAKHIPEVTTIDSAIQSMAGETRTATGSGGMATKVEAARIATRAGCATIITLGNRPSPLGAVDAGERATLFRASGTPAAQRKQWLAGALGVAGRLVIDAGAVRALADGGSLLPVGVVGLDGDFNRGDVVSIVSESGREVGRGLAEYAVAEASLLLGAKSSEIESRLGYRGRPALVHRDELVVFAHE
jgi:glutamate 5-kinase